MRIASNLYIKMAVPGWPFYVVQGLKSPRQQLATPAHVIRSAALTVSFTVTQFARESVGICHFRGSCMREYELI